MAINAKAKAALKRLGTLKLTLRVTIAGKTTTSTVTLRKPTKATARRSHIQGWGRRSQSGGAPVT